MKKVILVIDPPKNICSADLSRHDMEGYNPLEIELTKKALEKFTSVSLYTNLKKFTKRAWLHKKDLIFPMAWGECDKNSKALIPALCETNDISYLGADPYTQILCNDKYMAKKYAQIFGLQTPKGILLYKSQSISEIRKNLQYLSIPLVIKPNFGGGSCGISESNLVDDYEVAVQLIAELFKLNYSPIIAEEYIEGYEVSILLCKNNKGITFQGETKLTIDNEEYFTHKIWGFETKKVDFKKSHYQVCELIPKQDIEKAERMFLSFSKAEYLRVDGRINSKGFFVIELSVDCYLGPESDFCIAFKNINLSHSDFLLQLVENVGDI